MAKGVILKTSGGVYLIGTIQCSNGSWFDADGCYAYCNLEETEFWNEHQSRKLCSSATLLGHLPIVEKDWYKYRENFIDVEIPFDEVAQEYRG